MFSRLISLMQTMIQEWAPRLLRITDTGINIAYILCLFYDSRYVENTCLRLVFSTFPSCSQMAVVLYHSVIHGLGMKMKCSFNYIISITLQKITSDSSCSTMAVLTF